MITVIRKVVRNEVLNGPTKYEKSYTFEKFTDAVDLLDKFYKIDFGHYQRYVAKHKNSINNYDDEYYCGINYYFVIDDVYVECKIFGSKEYNDTFVFKETLWKE